MAPGWSWRWRSASRAQSCKRNGFHRMRQLYQVLERPLLSAEPRSEPAAGVVESRGTGAASCGFRAAAVAGRAWPCATDAEHDAHAHSHAHGDGCACSCVGDASAGSGAARPTCCSLKGVCEPVIQPILAWYDDGEALLSASSTTVQEAGMGVAA